MDNEQSVEQAPEKTEEQKAIEIHVEAMRQKYALADAIQDYHRAEAGYKKASAAYNTSANELRSRLARDARYIIKIDYVKHLVTCDKDGNFDITPIEELN